MSYGPDILPRQVDRTVLPPIGSPDERKAVTGFPLVFLCNPRDRQAIRAALPESRTLRHQVRAGSKRGSRGDHDHREHDQEDRKGRRSASQQEQSDQSKTDAVSRRHLYRTNARRVHATRFCPRDDCDTQCESRRRAAHHVSSNACPAVSCAG